MAPPLERARDEELARKLTICKVLSGIVLVVSIIAAAAELISGAPLGALGRTLGLGALVLSLLQAWRYVNLP